MSHPLNIDLAITGGHILTIDERMTEYRTGSVLISGGEIVWIGDEKEQPAGCIINERIDATGRIVMPAFFNGHNHAAMSIFRGLGNDLSLDRWLNDFIWPAERERINPATVYLGTKVSAIEMIRSGTGIFSDMYFFEEEVARVCDEAGIRGIIGEAILDFPSPSRVSPRDSFAHTRLLHSQFANHPLLTVSLAVHAPYTCSPPVIREAGELSRELGLPANIHLAETTTEISSMAERYKQTPVEYLLEHGFLNERTVAHHSVHLTEDDRKILQSAGTSVVTLPNSNMKLGSGACEVATLLACGINVAIGTDGPASNNNQSIVRDIQQLARLERVTHLDPTRLPARDLVRIATINGAKAYGMDALIGSLESGKKADIQIINPDQPHWYPRYDPYTGIAYAMHSEDVESVIVNGRILMKDRELLTIDEHRVIREMKAQPRFKPTPDR